MRKGCKRQIPVCKVDEQEIKWIDDFEIKITATDGEIVISANREGLLSLARQLTALANGAEGDHIHYDEYNSLAAGSAELIIERI